MPVSCSVSKCFTWVDVQFRFRSPEKTQATVNEFSSPRTFVKYSAGRMHVVIFPNCAFRSMTRSSDDSMPSARVSVPQCWGRKVASPWKITRNLCCILIDIKILFVLQIKLNQYKVTPCRQQPVVSGGGSLIVVRSAHTCSEIYR